MGRLKLIHIPDWLLIYTISMPLYSIRIVSRIDMSTI